MRTMDEMINSLPLTGDWSIGRMSSLSEDPGIYHARWEESIGNKKTSVHGRGKTPQQAMSNMLAEIGR